MAAGVAAEHESGAIRDLAGLRIRAVRDQQYGRRRRRAEPLPYSFGNDEHHLRAAARTEARASLSDSVASSSLTPLCLEIAQRAPAHTRRRIS